MDYFETLNRRTWENNNLRPVDPYQESKSSPYNYFNPYKQNYLNNQTYKANNNQYNKKYY